MASSKKSETLVFLRERLEEATSGLAHVSQKRLFSCDGFFRNGTIFALVWKEGRIGVKLRDAERHAELAARAGSSPWSPMGKGRAVSHWLLVPESFHDDDEALATWAREAHATAFPTEKKPSAKKPSAKKPSAKKLSAKKPSPTTKKAPPKKASAKVAPKKAAR
jgi:TfoX/Sxy family transcriptional regulator of competence genes